MRRLPPGAIRWPGGCFADSYDWRDGIGPRDRRPREQTSGSTRRDGQRPDGPWKHEPNHFGINEFAMLCRLAVARRTWRRTCEPGAQEFYEWIEYCNSPAGTTTLANMRAAAGNRDPYKVRFWGVGNESWGCGGKLHS